MKRTRPYLTVFLARATLMGLMAVTTVQGQTAVDLSRQARGIDFSNSSSTRPWAVGSSLPATCQTGQAFYRTGVVAGQNLYTCTSTNTWTQVIGGGGAGSVSGLSDLKLSAATGTLTISPGTARIGATTLPFTGVITATLSGTSGTGTAFVYVSSQGTLVAGHNTGATMSCTGCVAATGISTYPADSIPLGRWTFTTNVFDTSGYTDDRAAIASNVVAAGPGVSTSVNGVTGLMTLSTDSAVIPQYLTGSGVPSVNCVTGRDFYTDTTNGELYFCKTTNVWQKATNASVITSLNGQTGATQTFANDTNVTISSSGNIHTLGWAGILAGTRGGTGNGFLQFSGPATTAKTFTLPNASAAILTDNTSVTVLQGGTGAASFTAGAPLIGNGTGALSSGSRSGNTTTFATTSGSLTSGNCVKVDANGNLVDNGTACGSASAITSLNGQTGATQTFANDTNVTISSSGNTHTLGWTGTLGATRGGTGNAFFQVSGPATTTKTYTFPNSNATVITSVDTGSVTNAMLAGSIDLTTKVTGILPAANGGTANGFTAFSGPATTTKTFTLPNASATILTDNALVTAVQGGTGNGFFQVTGPATTTKTYTFPNSNATVITSVDTGSVSNTMLAGSIATSKLATLSGNGGTVATTTGTLTSGNCVKIDANGNLVDNGSACGGGGGGGGLSNLNGQTGATQTFANDTNVTISSSGNTHTLGWTGTLGATRGGTGNAFFQVSGPATTARTFTFPNQDATVITSVDTGSVTNTMLAGSIDLTTKVTGILPATNGGTANGFFQVSGPATSAKTYTFPNSNATVITSVDTGSVTNTMLAGSIDLTTKVTGILPATNGGTANGFTAFSGPTTSLKTFTLPNASATILTDNALVTVAQGGTGAGTLTGILKGNGTSAITTVIAPTGALVGTTDTQSLSNKTLSSPSLGTTPVTVTYTAGTGGTTAGLVVKTDSSGNVILPATSDVGIIGVAMSSVSAAAPVEVAIGGVTTCIADNTVTTNDVLIVGTTTGGRCRDSGQTNSTLISSGTQVIGRALSGGSAGANITVQLSGPSHYGYAGVAGANTALSNLASVSINTSLLAQTGVSLGSTTAAFKDIFLWGTGAFGSTSIQLTGAPTGNRVWTLQDATDTFVGRATTDTLTNKTYDTAGTGNSFKINGTAVTAVTGTGSVVLGSSPTVTTPAITTSATVTNGLAANTSGDGLVLQNTGAASSGNQEFSPRLRLTGAGWKTNATAASQVMDFTLETVPVQGAANPTAQMDVKAQINGGGYTSISGFNSSPSSTVPAIYLNGSTTSGFSFANSGVYGIVAGAASSYLTSAKAFYGSTLVVGWGSGTVTTAADTGIARNAAGVVEVNNGTAGTLRDLKIRREYASVNTVTFSATPTFDVSLGQHHTITLTGNVTSSTLSNLVAGEVVSFQICQDATGSRTFAWPSAVKGGMTIGTTASKCNVQNFVSYDGTNLYALSSGVTNQ